MEGGQSLALRSQAEPILLVREALNGHLPPYRHETPCYHGNNLPGPPLSRTNLPGESREGLPLAARLGANRIRCSGRH
jgi:hypothetical protein